MKITVIVRNETPIHSSSPTKAKINTNGVIHHTEGMPFTRMRTMNVPVQAGEGAFSIKPLPCVPSNSMRNLLRRSALDTVFGQLRGHSTLSVGAYAAACTGSASGNPEGTAATFDETIRVRQHVFLGLFGGGPRLMQGRLSVDSMYPIIPDATRIIGEGYEERMISGRILDVVWIRRVDPIAKPAIEDIEDLISDGKNAITEWSVKNFENQAKSAARRNGEADAESGDSERGLNAFNAHEVAIPGIDWLWNIRIDNPSSAQVGLVLKAISDIAERKMQIGGGHSRDYGKVNIQEVLIDGQSVWDGSGFCDGVETYFDALADALDNLSADDFTNFVKTSEQGEARANKKAAKGK